jgi:hypothetical protein
MNVLEIDGNAVGDYSAIQARPDAIVVRMSYYAMLPVVFTNKIFNRPPFGAVEWNFS